MKQAFHIFKKDVRYLRYDLGITLLAATAFCLMGVRNMRGPGPAAIILPVAWWFLIGRVIHAEPLPGNRQFWLTRPYRWKSLLGAKILFILTFVNLPLLLADAAIIHAAGFSISNELAGLLWTQVLLIAAFVLPAAAFSAITSGLAELLVVTLLLVFGILARLLTASFAHWGIYWMELEWVKTYYVLAQIAAAAAIVLLWQYARRSTFATRTVACAAALVLLASSALLPWTTAFALQTHLSKRNIDLSSIRIELDSDRKWMGRIFAGEQDQMIAELPLQISGLPAGTELKPNGLAVKLCAPDGETWVVNQSPPDSFNFEAGVTSLRAVMGRAFYAKVKDRPLQFRGTLYFTLYGNKQGAPIPLNRGPVMVNGVGLCSAGARFLLCNSAFRPQSDLVTIQMLQDSPGGAKATTEGLSDNASYSPFPAGVNVNPLYQFFSPRLKPIFQARIEASEPVAYLERNFEIDYVHLNDFALSSPLTASK
jgi:hypothetical protein